MNLHESVLVTMRVTAAFLVFAGYMGVEPSSPVTASAEAPAAVDVTGKWEGSWDYRAEHGGVTLTLKQEGAAVTGTIQMRRTRTFGDDEKPIREGKVSGSTFSFLADGGGGTIDASLSVKASSMYGTFTYAGRTYSYSLQRR